MFMFCYVVCVLINSQKHVIINHMKRYFIPFLFCSAWAPVDNSNLSLSCFKNVAQFVQPQACKALFQVSPAIRRCVNVADLVLDLFKENGAEYLSFGCIEENCDHQYCHFKIGAKPKLQELKDFVLNFYPKVENECRPSYKLLPLSELNQREIEVLMCENDPQALSHYVLTQLEQLENAEISIDELVANLIALVENHEKLQSIDFFYNMLNDLKKLFVKDNNFIEVLFKLAENGINFATYCIHDLCTYSRAISEDLKKRIQDRFEQFIIAHHSICAAECWSIGYKDNQKWASYDLNWLYALINMRSENVNEEIFKSLEKNDDATRGNHIAQALLRAGYQPMVNIFEIKAFLAAYGISFEFTSRDLTKYIFLTHQQDVSFVEELNIDDETLEQLAVNRKFKAAQIIFAKRMKEQNNWTKMVELVLHGCSNHSYSDGWSYDWYAAREALCNFLNSKERTQEKIDLEKQIIENSSKWKHKADRVYSECIETLNDRIEKGSNQEDRRLLEIAARDNDRNSIMLYVKSVLLGLNGFEQNVALIESFADNVGLFTNQDSRNFSEFSMLTKISQKFYVAYLYYSNQGKSIQEIGELLNRHFYRVYGIFSDPIYQEYAQRGWDAIAFAISDIPAYRQEWCDNNKSVSEQAFQQMLNYQLQVLSKEYGHNISRESDRMGILSRVVLQMRNPFKTAKENLVIGLLNLS